jgi:hypothetical protein
METQASVKTKCDGCGATLSSNSSYSDKRGAMSLSLKDGQNDNGYDQYNRYDYCGESCMLAHLQNRAKAAKVAKGNVVGMTIAQASVFKTFELDIASTLPKKS